MQVVKTLSKLTYCINSLFQNAQLSLFLSHASEKLEQGADKTKES